VSSDATVAQVKWLEKKVAAGAEFVFSQPVFTLDDFKKLRDAISHLAVRFFPGIMPLVSERNAAFMAAGHIPGIKVHASLVEKFAAYGDKKDQRKFGLETAHRLAQAIAEQADGLYIIMPFGKKCYSDTSGLVRSLSRKPMVK